MRIGNFIKKNIALSQPSLYKEAEGDVPADDMSLDMDMGDMTSDMSDSGASIDEMSDPMHGVDEHESSIDDMMGDMGMDDSTFDERWVPLSGDDEGLDTPDKDDIDAKRRETLKESFIALYDKYEQTLSELKHIEFPVGFNDKVSPIIKEYDRLLKLVDVYIAMYVVDEKPILILKTFIEVKSAFAILDNQLNSLKDEYLKFIENE